MFTNFVYFIIIENHVPIHLFYQLKLCQDNFSGNILFKTKINEMSYILIDQGQKHVAGMSERHINQNTRRTHLLNLQPVFVIFFHLLSVSTENQEMGEIDAAWILCFSNLPEIVFLKWEMKMYHCLYFSPVRWLNPNHACVIASQLYEILKNEQK